MLCAEVRVDFRRTGDQAETSQAVGQVRQFRENLNYLFSSGVARAAQAVGPVFCPSRKKCYRLVCRWKPPAIDAIRASPLRAVSAPRAGCRSLSTAARTPP